MVSSSFGAEFIQALVSSFHVIVHLGRLEIQENAFCEQNDVFWV